jgi:hypothetical protein
MNPNAPVGMVFLVKGKTNEWGDKHAICIRPVRYKNKLRAGSDRIRPLSTARMRGVCSNDTETFHPIF